MADKIVILEDENGNNIYPITRGLAADSVDTNAIQDGAVTSSKIDSATYTTTEKRVGTWINGKPLYRRIVVSTTAATITDGTTSTIQISFASIGISNPDFIFTDGIVLEDGTSQSAWVLNNANYFLRAGAFKSGGYIFNQTNRASLANMACYITVYYTKTTD